MLAFWILLTVISITCLYKARLEMKERKKMEDLLSQERSSSKPLIRDQKPEISWDSTQSSDDEQTAESSDPSAWTASKESLIYTDLDSTKSTVSEKVSTNTLSPADGKTVSALETKANLPNAEVISPGSRKPVPANDVNEAFDELFGNHDEFKARSSGTSKAAKRKTVAAVDKRKPSTSKSDERVIKHKTSRSTSDSRTQSSSKHQSSGGKRSHRQNTAMSFMDQVFDIV